MTIGKQVIASDPTWSFPFKGRLDDIRVYSVPLTAAEIYAIGGEKRK
jgi:hypothetical protein